MGITDTKTTDSQTYAISHDPTTAETFLLVSTTEYIKSVGVSLSTDTINGVVNTEIWYGPAGTVTSISVTGYLPAPIPTSSSSTSSSPSVSSPPSTSTAPTPTTPGSSIAANQPASASASTTPKTKANVGATAGAAVGGLIVGALIAGLLAFFIMSRRQKKRSSRYDGGFASERHRSSRPSNEKALPSAPLLGGDAVGNWAKHLDQPESDNTIMRSVRGLFDHIEVHVENFYRDAQIPITHELQDALIAVEDSRELPDSIVGLLPLTERPTMLIKHCLAHSIVEHITSESDVPDSFLPTDFTALPQALNTPRTTANKRVYNQAYAQWRVLSAYLRPKPAEDPAYTRTRDTHIAALADKLCRTFEPWALSRDNFSSRRESLIKIMKVGADTGVLLFSQPSTFQWIWRKSSGGGKGARLAVVLLPGLEKVRDEEARALETGVVVLRPVEGVLVG